MSERRFYALVDLANLLARQPLQELPLERAAKNAHHALVRGERSIPFNGDVLTAGTNGKGNPCFRIPAAIPAELVIHKSKPRQGADKNSNFCVLSLGLKQDTRTIDEFGIEQTSSQPVKFTGRVIDGNGGDPVLYFEDPNSNAVHEARQSGLRDMMNFILAFEDQPTVMKLLATMPEDLVAEFEDMEP